MPRNADANWNDFVLNLLFFSLSNVKIFLLKYRYTQMKCIQIKVWISALRVKWLASLIFAGKKFTKKSYFSHIEDWSSERRN